MRTKTGDLVFTLLSRGETRKQIAYYLKTNELFLIKCEIGSMQLTDDQFNMLRKLAFIKI